MIDVKDLTVTYGEERAVDNISFHVPQGQILGFLGPNGAGKTTTMKVLTAYLPPTEGTSLIDGMDVRENSVDVRRKIGYLPEDTPLYREMNTVEYLRFIAAMREIPREKWDDRIAQMVEICGLEQVVQKRIEELSKGYRQRVGLAQAIIHDPPILILDEPTTGLDPNQIVEIRELIKSLGEEKTVILSTHILQEVQASCDRVLIIHHGQLVADGTPSDLQARFTGGQRVQFGVQAGMDQVEEVLGTRSDLQVVKATPENGSTLFDLVTEREDDVRPELFQLAVDQGWTLTELHREQVNLEDVFQELTRE